MAFIQSNTNLQIVTPFGADAMLLMRFHAEERISSLFHFRLELLSKSKDLDFANILGKGVTVKVTLSSGALVAFTALLRGSHKQDT